MGVQLSVVGCPVSPVCLGVLSSLSGCPVVGVWVSCCRCWGVLLVSGCPVGVWVSCWCVGVMLSVSGYPVVGVWVSSCRCLGVLLVSGCPVGVWVSCWCLGVLLVYGCPAVGVWVSCCRCWGVLLLVSGCPVLLFDLYWPVPPPGLLSPANRGVCNPSYQGLITNEYLRCSRSTVSCLNPPDILSVAVSVVWSNKVLMCREYDRLFYLAME